VVGAVDDLRRDFMVDKMKTMSKGRKIKRIPNTAKKIDRPESDRPMEN